MCAAPLRAPCLGRPDKLLGSSLTQASLTISNNVNLRLWHKTVLSLDNRKGIHLVTISDLEREPGTASEMHPNAPWAQQCLGLICQETA